MKKYNPVTKCLETVKTNDKRLIEPTKQVLDELKRKITKAGFKVESERKSAFDNIHVHFVIRYKSKTDDETLVKILEDRLDTILRNLDKKYKTRSKFVLDWGKDKSVTAGINIGGMMVNDSKTKANDLKTTDAFSLHDLRNAHGENKRVQILNKNYAEVFYGVVGEALKDKRFAGKNYKMLPEQHGVAKFVMLDNKTVDKRTVDFDRTYYKDKYNSNKVWEITKQSGGNYYVKQFINGKQFGKGTRMSKEMIMDLGLGKVVKSPTEDNKTVDVDLRANSPTQLANTANRLEKLTEQLLANKGDVKGEIKNKKALKADIKNFRQFLKMIEKYTVACNKWIDSVESDLNK